MLIVAEVLFEDVSDTLSDGTPFLNLLNTSSPLAYFVRKASPTCGADTTSKLVKAFAPKH